MKDPEYLEIIPNRFPEDYTFRAEYIRELAKGIAFIVLITIVMYVGLMWVRP